MQSQTSITKKKKKNKKKQKKNRTYLKKVKEMAPDKTLMHVIAQAVVEATKAAILLVGETRSSSENM